MNTYGQEMLLTIGALLASIVLFFVMDILREIKKIKHIPELIEKVSKLVDRVDFLVQKYAVYEEKIIQLEKRIEKLEERFYDN
jgi:hypothetical protein